MLTVNPQIAKNVYISKQLKDYRKSHNYKVNLKKDIYRAMFLLLKKKIKYINIYI